MTRDFSSIVNAAQAVDWVRAASVATVTAIVLFVVLVAIGFSLLFARGRRGAGPAADHARQQEANILLVRVDDAIKSSEDELGFAIAQFGEEKPRVTRRPLPRRGNNWRRRSRCSSGWMTPRRTAQPRRTSGAQGSSICAKAPR